MYKAVFEIAGWSGPETHEFKGKTLAEIVDKLQQIQSLECLVQMGHMQGSAEDLEPLDRLENFLGKYYAGKLRMSDFEQFDLKLSVGGIRCVEISKSSCQ